MNNDYGLGNLSKLLPTGTQHSWSYPKECEHCYCTDEDVNGKAHKKCCMCGNRRLKTSLE